MTLPVYPAALPAPLRSDFSEQAGEGRQMLRQDAGPPNVRRRFSAVANEVTFSTLLTRLQLGIFDTFYTEQTKKGALPFLIKNPGADEYPLLTEGGVPILNEDGLPILVSDWWVVFFGQRLPRRNQQDLEWRLSFDLIVMPTK